MTWPWSKPCPDCPRHKQAYEALVVASQERDRTIDRLTTILETMSRSLLVTKPNLWPEPEPGWKEAQDRKVLEELTKPKVQEVPW